MIVDLYKHAHDGRRIWAVLSGVDPHQDHPTMAHSSDMRLLRLHRRGLALGVAQQPVFDHARVRADIERQGWSKFTCAELSPPPPSVEQPSVSPELTDVRA